MPVQVGVAEASVGVGRSILGIEFDGFVKVLERQNADVQIFLLLTSILERICEPLCKVVLGEDAKKNLSLIILIAPACPPIEATYLQKRYNRTL